MTLNASEPSAVRLVRSLPSYIRETRAAVNSVITGTGFSTTILALAGETSLTVGVRLANVGHEIIFATSTGATVLATILGGTNGQLKTFVFGDGNITFTDGTKDSGKFYLNISPALDPLTFNARYTICLVNEGGDGGVSDHGWWREIWKTEAVK